MPMTFEDYITEGYSEKEAQKAVEYEKSLMQAPTVNELKYNKKMTIEELIKDGYTPEEALKALEYEKNEMKQPTAINVSIV
jgi:hypothetical protein